MATKKISVCTDEANRITGLCMSDMSGNTGWVYLPAAGVGLDMTSALHDERGACLYRLENGAAVPRAEEERRQDWPDEPEQVDEIAALCAEVDMLTECVLEMSEIVYGE